MSACGELLLSCAMPTSSWRWYCSGRPTVSSPTGLSPRLTRYVAAPFPRFPLLTLACKAKVNPSKRLHQAHPCSPTIGLHSFLAAESSLPPGCASPLSKRQLQQCLSAFREGVNRPPHTPYMSRRSCRYYVSRSPRILDGYVVVDEPPLTIDPTLVPLGQPISLLYGLQRRGSVCVTRVTKRVLRDFFIS